MSSKFISLQLGCSLGSSLGRQGLGRQVSGLLLQAWEPSHKAPRNTIIGLWPFPLNIITKSAVYFHRISPFHQAGPTPTSDIFNSLCNFQRSTTTAPFWKSLVCPRPPQWLSDLDITTSPAGALYYRNIPLSFGFPHPPTSHWPANSPLPLYPSPGSNRPHQTQLEFSSPSRPYDVPSSQDPGTVPCPRLVSPSTAWDTTSKKLRDASVSPHRWWAEDAPPNLPPQVSLDSTLKFTTSTPTPFLPSPQPLALRGFGYPCPQTRSKHADADRPPRTPGSGPSPPPPPPPEVPLTPEAGVGEGTGGAV